MAAVVCLAQDLKYESQKKGSVVNTGAEDKNKIGHFDFGIAYPVDINGSAGLFTESSEEKLKYDTLVSLNKKELSILDAIDLLCKQAGYVWNIKFYDDDKPFIHLEHKG